MQFWRKSPLLVMVWYHKKLAMNLRVPEDLDRRLDQLAAEVHTSKSALLLQGAELVLQRHRRRRDIGEGLHFVVSHDAELLTSRDADLSTWASRTCDH